MGNPVTLAETVGYYLGRLDADGQREGQIELNRFVRWYGSNRSLAQLTSREVESYAESLGNTTVDAAKRLEPLRGFFAFAKKEGLTSTNLGVHLRLRKTTLRRKATPERARASVQLTQEGSAQLQSELEALKAQRPLISAELRRAMADKDFRENAPLDAAREHQGQVEARIRELEATLKAAAVLVQGNESSRAALGSTVVVRNLEGGEELRYTLVNPREVDLARSRISVASPTGRALLDRSPGEVVEVIAPAGLLRYRIEAIQE